MENDILEINGIKISVTKEYEKLVKFFIENELEFSVNDEVPTDLLKLWKAETSEGILVAGCVLALREEEFIIDGIAVDSTIREMKLGQKLLELAIGEVKKRNGSSLYLVARAPGFFRKQGFQTIERENAPNFFECFTCPQYGKTCHPEVMRLDFA